MQFLWNYVPLFFLLSLTVQVWQRQSSGATRAPTPRQLEKGESGGTFWQPTWGPEPWVLQRGVRVGARVFLITHLTEPAFKYPGGSRSRSLLLSRDSSFASIDPSLSQTQKLEKPLTVQWDWTYCMYTSSLYFPLWYLHPSLSSSSSAVQPGPCLPRFSDRNFGSPPKVLHASLVTAACFFFLPRSSSPRPPSPPAVKLVTGLSGVVRAAVK